MKSDFLNCVCAEYDISEEEKDAVVMNIRKHLEDYIGEEIVIKRVVDNSGVECEKVKVIFFTLLCEGEIVRAVKGKKYLHFYGKRIDGAIAN